MLKEKTQSGIQSAEAQFGIRYSVLLNLPYFDPIISTAIDTLHNLFLGTGKHCFVVWVEEGLVSKPKLIELENKAELFTVPAGIGRLPCSFSSSYGAFTASQWRTWITVYSPVILKTILPPSDLQCWLLFVRACSILCSHCILQSDITSVDMFLEQFCRQFERLYGSTQCTFNMHLHLHLKQTFLNFGPPHASWCFAFERFNGLLGSFHTNNKEIESQIMRKFCQSQSIHGIDIPLDDHMKSLFSGEFQKDMTSTLHSDSFHLLHIAQSHIGQITTFAFVKNAGIDPFKPFHNDIFSDDITKELESTYKQLYPQRTICSVLRFYRKFYRVLVADDLIGSSAPGPNNKNSSVIMAYWSKSGCSLNEIDYNRMQVGIVQYFISHTQSFLEESEVREEEHIFACVRWKEQHPHYDWFGISATVCVNSNTSDSPFVLLPVQRIACRCATIVMPVDFGTLTETVFIACPIPLRYSLL